MDLRIGVIGGGGIGRAHAETVTGQGHEIAAVADIDADARDHFESTYGAATYAEYEAMVADEALDAVLVTVPNALHADATIAALEAGCHVLVEKPLAHTVADAERIVEAAASTDRSVMVGFHMPFTSGARAAKARIDRGDVGEVYEADATYVRRRGIPQIGSWFTRKEVSGGGVLIDVGVHVIHLALHLLDFPTVERVSGATTTAFGDRDDYTYLSMWGGDPTDDATFDVEDNARATIRTAGPTIHLDCAWAANREPTYSVAVHGDAAGLDVHPGGSEATLRGSDAGSLTTTEHEAPDIDGKAAEWSYFADVIAGDRDHTRNTPEEGLVVQRVIDAIYESADRGREVEV